MFGIKIVLFLILPFSVDEAFNFVYFADKGLFLTTTFSNNHILYNLFSSAWSKTGLDPLYTCRITSIMAGMVVHFVIFILARHFFSFTVALWTMFLTGVTLWVNVLSTIGTTYMLMTCCWLIGMAALIRIIRSRGNAGQYLFIFISTIGMYASKIFIIPLGGLVLTWICFEIKFGTIKKNTLKIILVTATIATLTLLLYLPMYLWSGGEAVFATHLVLHSFPEHFPLLLETMSIATDVNSKTYIVLVLYLLVGILFYKRASNNLKFLFTVAAANIFALAIFILAVHVYPPGRALIYLNIIFFGLLALGISEFIPKLIQKEHEVNIFYSVALAAKILGSIYIFHYGWQTRLIGDIQDHAFYKRLDQIADCIVSTQPKAVYEDRQDRFLSFYTRLAAIRRSVPLVFEYSQAQADSCDVCIFYEHPPHVLEGHLQVCASDFGDIYLKRNRIPTIDSSCFQTDDGL
nr:glycosyltransferase family 39 protein [Dawidia cretensis]